MKKDNSKPIYRLTQHVRQRFYERVLNEEWKGQSLKDKELITMFYDSKEMLGWQNNTHLVDYMRNKFGTTKIKLFKSENNFIFVANRHESIPNLFFIVTLYKSNEHGWI